jgi:hypothetical protein
MADVCGAPVVKRKSENIGKQSYLQSFLFFAD